MKRDRRASERGMTLIETIIVLFIVVLLLGAVVFATGMVQRARLRGGAALISSMMRSAVQRAAAKGRRLRLVVDFASTSAWLEESNDEVVVNKKDTSGSGGASPATEAERKAKEDADRLNKGPRAAPASFNRLPEDDPLAKTIRPDCPVEEDPVKHCLPLGNGIKFRAVDAAHDDKARTTGRGYVYFFGSEAERASVQLRIGDSNEDTDTMSIVLSPMTGNAVVQNGPVAIKRPAEDATDQEQSEVVDDGY